jgi:hypothetical protein
MATSVDSVLNISIFVNSNLTIDDLISIIGEYEFKLGVTINYNKLIASINKLPAVNYTQGSLIVGGTPVDSFTCNVNQYLKFDYSLINILENEG